MPDFIVLPPPFTQHKCRDRREKSSPWNLNLGKGHENGILEVNYPKHSAPHHSVQCWIEAVWYSTSFPATFLVFQTLPPRKINPDTGTAPFPSRTALESALLLLPAILNEIQGHGSESNIDPLVGNVIYCMSRVLYVIDWAASTPVEEEGRKGRNE